MRKIPRAEVRYRWVHETEADEEYCDIVQEGTYENGDKNGYVEIQYYCNSYGGVIPVHRWNDINKDRITEESEDTKYQKFKIK